MVVSGSIGNFLVWLRLVLGLPLLWSRSAAAQRWRFCMTHIHLSQSSAPIKTQQATIISTLRSFGYLPQASGVVLLPAALEPPHHLEPLKKSHTSHKSSRGKRCARMCMLSNAACRRPRGSARRILRGSIARSAGGAVALLWDL